MPTRGCLSFLEKKLLEIHIGPSFVISFDFHLDGQLHPDLFMKLFASSLTEDAKGWIDTVPVKSIKNVEGLEKAFKVRWCDKENPEHLFSQYTNICKGPCESIREFSDRFNLALKKVRSKVGSEQAIIDHYLFSLEGDLHFKVKDQSPTTLEEAQELAFEVERKLEFEESIMNFEAWDPGDEPMLEPEDPSILQVELPHTKRKWSLLQDDTSSQEPPPKRLNRKMKFVEHMRNWIQIRYKTFPFSSIKWEIQLQRNMISDPFMSLSK
jgi:hypothetical protein